MAKKVLSVVLAVAMLMGVCAVGSFAAATDWKKEVEKCFIGEIMYAGGKMATTDEMLAQFLDEDPEILERNLYFWDDYVADTYHDLCANGTNSDWEDFYYEIAEDNYLNDDYWYYWPTYIKPEKATVELTYEADKENVECGDEITVTLSAKTNFYTSGSTFAIFYDQTQVELKGTGDSRALYAAGENGIDALGDCWKNFAKNYAYGLDTSGNILYTTSKITHTQVDQRDENWPAEWRGNADNYAKYNILTAQFSADDTMKADPAYRVARMFNGETVMSATFVVKEGLADGTEISFFALPGGARSLEDDLAFADITGNYARPLLQKRAIGPFSNRVPYEPNQVSHTYTFNNAVVTVGSPAPEYADYTALDAATDAYDDTNAADYTPATWAAYAEAVADGLDLARDILKENQATVDDATAAITSAKAALAKNTVVSVKQTATPTIGSEATVEVLVTGSPDLLIFASAGTKTFPRANAVITDNGDGTETWTIKTFADSESTSYNVFAKYANVTDDNVPFTLKATNGLDLSIHSIEIPDGYPNGGNGDTVYYGKHTVIIKTSTDVTKIQFVNNMDKIDQGATSTYAVNGGGKACEVTDDETTGERTWVITFNFNVYGSWSKVIRTRSAKTLFATTGDVFSARVVY